MQPYPGVGKRITISIDDETHRLAKATAPSPGYGKGTTVSAMVRDYLNNLPLKPHDPPKKTLSEVIADFRAKGLKLSSADNLPREKLYDRSRDTDALR